ncbi:MAG: NMD3-related protein [Candidatus Helarchaeota archaeon]
MTGSRFCIKCGKDNLKKSELIENLCFDCYKEMNPLFTINRQKIPTLFLCKNCQNFRFSYNKKWSHPKENFFEDITSDLSANSSKFIKKDENIEIQFSIIDENKINFEVLNSNRMLRVRLDAVKIGEGDSENQFMDTEEIPIKIEVSICDKCNQIRRNLSRVELHFQGKNRMLKEDEILYIEEIIENEFEKFLKINPDVFILIPSKKGRVLKYKISSFKLAKKIANLIKNQLDATLREAFKYEDREKSRNKVRSQAIITVILPPFRVGEIFELRNEIYQVTSIMNKTIICLNLYSFQKTKFSFDDLKHAKEITDEMLNSFTILFISNNNVQIMDNSTFMTYDIPIKEPLKNVKEGMEIRGIKKENKIILIQ